MSVFWYFGQIRQGCQKEFQITSNGCVKKTRFTKFYFHLNLKKNSSSEMQLKCCFDSPSPTSIQLALQSVDPGRGTPPTPSNRAKKIRKILFTGFSSDSGSCTLDIDGASHPARTLQTSPGTSDETRDCTITAPYCACARTSGHVQH